MTYLMCQATNVECQMPNAIRLPGPQIPRKFLAHFGVRVILNSRHECSTWNGIRISGKETQEWPRNNHATASAEACPA